MNAFLDSVGPYAPFLVFLLAAGESAAFLGLFIPGEAAVVFGGVLAGPAGCHFGGRRRWIWQRWSTGATSEGQPHE